MNGAVTTAEVWVCSKCGAVLRTSESVGLQTIEFGPCPYTRTRFPEPRHSFKPVLVVVPYA